MRHAMHEYSQIWPTDFLILALSVICMMQTLDTRECELMKAFLSDIPYTVLTAVPVVGREKSCFWRVKPGIGLLVDVVPVPDL